MRTSGSERDLGVLLIPLSVLIVVGLWFAGRGGRFFPMLEKQLWNAVQTAGRWVAALLS